MKRYFKNRVTGVIFLSVVMMFSCLYGFFAADSEHVKAEGNEVTVETDQELYTAFYEAYDGTVIKLNNDISIERFGIPISSDEDPADNANHIEIDNKKVTLDLKGHTLIWARGAAEDEMIDVKNGGELTICDSKEDSTSTFNYTIVRDGGEKEECTYSGGGITLKKCYDDEVVWHLIHVTDNSKLIVEGGAIYGNTGGAGSGILAENGATVELKDCVIADNHADNKAGGILLNNSNLYIKGDTIITGNSSGTQGGGIVAENGAHVNIASDAYITNNSSKSENRRPDGDGGGIYLSGKSTEFNMSAGHINGNISKTGGGGGICAGFYGDDTVKIDITGGSICANRSFCEGGGLSIGSGCSARIVADDDKYVKINYNEVDDNTEDWGGGGIFVASRGAGNPGTLYTEAIVITNNTAYGFGGGVAGCATGRLFINEKGDALDVNTRGGGIFGNTALASHDENYIATGHLSGARSTKNEDHIYTDGNKTFWDGGFQDYFCALNSRVGEDMFGGGKSLWYGTADSKVVDNSSDTEDGTVLASYLTGLTSRSTEADRNSAYANARVFVEYNKSGTHGGGILTNGILTIGAAPGNLSVYDRITVSADKKILNYKEEEKDHPEEGFTFEILDEDRNLINTVRSFTSESDKKIGQLAASLPYDREKGEVNTYYLVEKDVDDPDYITDKTEYQIDLKGETQEEIITDLFGNQTDMKISVITGTDIYQIKDGQKVQIFEYDRDGDVLNLYGEASEDAGSYIDLTTGVDHAKKLYLDKIVKGSVFTNTYVEEPEEPEKSDEPEDPTPTESVITEVPATSTPQVTDVPSTPEPTSPLVRITESPAPTYTPVPSPTVAPQVSQLPTSTPVISTPPDNTEFTDLDDNNVPFSSLEEEDEDEDEDSLVDLEDDDTPRSSARNSASDRVVETGDKTPITGVMIAAFVALMGLVISVYLIAEE